MPRSWPALDIAGLPADGTDAGEPLHAALADADLAAIDETTPGRWRVFFTSADGRDRAAASLRERLPQFTTEVVDVPDDDWAGRSQADLRAVQVGRVIVAPPWDAPVTIVIQPSMGFGTGHHATTRRCLAALQRLPLAGASVLDVGTGSAVLAIAASRLGAADVTGIDDDADAIQAAWENLALNPGAQVSLLVGDLRSTALNAADVVLANLTGALLVAVAPRLRTLANARARLILSGFQTHEERDVVSAYAAFSVEHREEEEGWVCLTMG